MRPLSLAVIGAALFSGLLAAPAAAQICDAPTDTFWKSDTLPQVPGGALPVSVIQGLCEGEAAGQAFYLAPGQETQRIQKVSVGFGHTSGAGGFNATCNVEVFDGVTWVGNTPTLGPKVFDLNADAAASMQVFSTGINEIDLSVYDIEVGASGSFVVAFRMNINPNGSCLGGFPANFITDGNGGGCTSTPQTSLMDIQGQGWVEARSATVSGFPLCPTFYNGNWLIRACTEDATGNGEFIDVGNQLTGFFAPSLTGSGSLAEGEAFTLTFAGMPISTTAYLIFGLTASNTPFRGGVLVPTPTFVKTFPTPPQAFATVDLNGSLGPGVPSLTNVFVQGWFPDAGGPVGVSASNGLQLITP